MSYLRYLCLFAYIGVQHVLRLCVPHVASFFGLSFLIAPSVFSNVYLVLFAIVSCVTFLSSQGLDPHEILVHCLVKNFHCDAPFLIPNNKK